MWETRSIRPWEVAELRDQFVWKGLAKDIVDIIPDSFFRMGIKFGYTTDEMFEHATNTIYTIRASRAENPNEVAARSASRR